MTDSTPSPRVRALVTAGPTHEPIDAVRYLGNRSSGRMGCAVAAALAARGAEVTLLAGPGVDAPAGIPTIQFRTAHDLHQALEQHWPDHDLLVMAAAVADFRPAAPATTAKLRRGDRPLHLALEPVPDLLAGLAAGARPDQTLVGFALEPIEDLDRSARAKLVRKGLHAIVANPIETMDSVEVDGRLITADGHEHRPAGGRCPKSAFAAWMAGLLMPMAERRLSLGA
jgi:phosphopantothenoylcysteine decarboxylase/phosphopantothenate--cysteine ligase